MILGMGKIIHAWFRSGGSEGSPEQPSGEERPMEPEETPPPDPRRIELGHGYFLKALPLFKRSESQPTRNVLEGWVGWVETDQVKGLSHKLEPMSLEALTDWAKGVVEAILYTQEYERKNPKTSR